MIDHALNGYCGTLFVYGQTGTGKTYTITGPPGVKGRDPSKDGVVPQAMDYLFEKLEGDPSIKVSFNFIQLYRDNVEDLMTPNAKLPKDTKGTQEIKLNRVELREHVGLDGLKGMVTTQTADKTEFFRHYEYGCSNRALAETKMNDNSSRGHTLLVLHLLKEVEKLEVKDGASVDVEELEKRRDHKGQLIFADLAGYERMKKTQIKDAIRKDEATAINASLLALSKVIRDLTANRQHISWRDSKLTRILQSSLVGNSITSIVVTMNSLPFHVTETQNSLHFGSAAMKVTTQTKVVYSSAADYKKHLLALQIQYKQLLVEKQELEEENVKLRNQTHVTPSAPPEPVAQVSAEEVARHQKIEETLRQELNEAIDALEDLESQLTEKEDKLEESLSALDAQDILIRDLQTELGQKNEEIQELNKEMDEAANMLDENETELNILRKQVEGDEGAEDVIQMVEELENQLKDVRTQYEDCKAKLDKQEEKKLNLQDTQAAGSSSAITPASEPQFLQSILDKLKQDKDGWDDDEETSACGYSAMVQDDDAEEEWDEEEEEEEDENGESQAFRLFGPKANKSKEPEVEGGSWRSNFFGDDDTEDIATDTSKTLQATSSSTSSASTETKSTQTEPLDGLSKTLVPASTPKQPSKPTVSNIRIEGQCLCMSTLYPSFKFTGGKEGDCIVKWYKSVDGYSFYEVQRSLIPPKSLYVCADFVHHYIRIMVIPRAKDGTRGSPSYSKLVYINVDPVLDKTIKEMVLYGSVSFNVKVNMGKQTEQDLVLRFDSKKVRLCLPSITEEITKDKKKTHVLFSAAWGDTIQMFTHHSNSEVRFQLRQVLKKKSWRILFSVPQKADRDVILLAFRAFYAMGREHVLKHILPKEGKKEWKQGKWKNVDIQKRTDILARSLRAPPPVFTKYSQQHRPGSHRTFFHLIEEMAIEFEIDKKALKDKKYPFLLD
eukprot:TRINITY_DN63124_c0_g1_i1.p1 TRINITY_DN63124_c0_g1~~TRINITY_DN63124_c0_g1_i1.p1  ORF type:complete len:1037 (+),score=146.38 TRINITY_DN63124_c0_g1_i1:264-3113(+)